MTSAARALRWALTPLAACACAFAAAGGAGAATRAAVAPYTIAAAAQAVAPYVAGDRVAARGLIDQHGRPFAFDDGSGRATALSFIYTQCRDAAGCPTITARFAKLRARVDQHRVRLALVTIAPRTDTPAALRRYAEAFGRDGRRLTFVTGDARAIADLARRFAIVGAERDPDGALDHAERLVILDGDARVADGIDGTLWSPDDAALAVDTVAGIAHDPLRLLALHLTWAVEHRCGVAPTGARTSLHHDAVAVALLLPPLPLGVLLMRERRRRRAA